MYKKIYLPKQQNFAFFNTDFIEFLIKKKNTKIQMPDK